MTSANANSSAAGAEKAVFQSTLWSRIVAAAHRDSPEAAESLNELCRLYWFPTYAYLRRSGHDPHQSKDLTQGFFAYLLANGVLKKATPELGRFRSFLLGTLSNFVSHEREKARAQRRGGGCQIVSIDEETAEGLYAHEPCTQLTPDQLFERRWALAVLEEAVRRLQTEYERAQMLAVFTELRPWLSGDVDMSFKELGARLQRSEGAARVQVYRLRERFRQVIADTVRDQSQIDEDMKHLQAALRIKS
jgi:RNA polymerase sigma factor (sigma-70 family)